MWCLVSAVLLAVCLASAEPQRGYDYLPPTIPFPTPECVDKTSVVYSTSVRQSVIPTTLRQINTQYVTTTIYSQRVVPTTLYRTRYESRVQYQTSYVQRQTQVARERVVTLTQQGSLVVQSRYVTSTRIVPQVSYVVRERVETRVVPVEVTSTRYETRYQDQVQYQTVPVQRTTVVRVPGRDVYSTVYDTQIRSSVVQQPQPAQTRYRTTTLIDNRVETRTVPSPPVIRTSYVQSQRVIPTTVVNTQFQTRYVTKTSYVARTQYQTQTRVQTQYVPQEVLVTVDVPREVLRTEYRTQVVPTTSVQTRYETRVRPVSPVVQTRQEYQTSIVRIPGQDRVVTSQVVDTQVRQQVVYRTEYVQRPVTVTRTVEVPCAQTGYNYPEPQVQFRF